MIELTAEQIEKAERALENIPDGVPKVIVRAINRAAESARTEASRKVREKYYVKHSDVISTIKIYKASPADYSATIISKGHVLALPKFRVTPREPEPKRKKSIIVRVKRGGGGPLPGAFVAQMKSGHVGVFKRVGKPRLPIEQKYGPSVPQMLGSPSVSQWIEEKAQETLEKRLDHEINRLLGENE